MTQYLRDITTWFKIFQHASSDHVQLLWLCFQGSASLKLIPCRLGLSTPQFSCISHSGYQQWIGGTKMEWCCVLVLWELVHTREYQWDRLCCLPLGGLLVVGHQFLHCNWILGATRGGVMTKGMALLAPGPRSGWVLFPGLCRGQCLGGIRFNVCHWGIFQKNQVLVKVSKVLWKILKLDDAFCEVCEVLCQYTKEVADILQEGSYQSYDLCDSNPQHYSLCSTFSATQIFKIRFCYCNMATHLSELNTIKINEKCSVNQRLLGIMGQIFENLFLS